MTVEKKLMSIISLLIISIIAIGVFNSVNMFSLNKKINFVYNNKDVDKVSNQVNSLTFEL